MEKDNKNDELNNTDKKLHISDVSDRNLSKNDCVIVLYDDGEEYFSVDVNKDYGEYIGKFDGEFSFQKELDILNIKYEGDEHIYYGDMSFNQLKNELAGRGFRIEVR
jgi:hypothetical protein